MLRPLRLKKEGKMSVVIVNRGGKQPYLIAKSPLFSGWLGWNDTFTAGLDPDGEEREAYRWTLFWSAVDYAENKGWSVQNKYDEEKANLIAV